MTANIDSLGNKNKEEVTTPKKRANTAAETIEGKSEGETTAGDSITKRTAIEIAFGKI